MPAYTIRLFFLAVFLPGLAIAQPTKLEAQRNVLERIIRDNKNDFGPWATAPADYDVQVIYTQIERDKDGRPRLTSHRWGVDGSEYFYPASTVKMPTALLALEKVHRLGLPGVDRDTYLRTGAGRAPQTPALVDESAPNMLPSVGHYARKIFLTSDNDAHNRLYEFLGQAELNMGLREHGFNRSRIIHRLSVSGFDTLGNRYANPVSLLRGGDTLAYYRGEQYSMLYDDFDLTDQVRGKGYLDDATNEVVMQPFDFRYKNYLSVQDLHDMVRAIVLPESVAAERRFDLGPGDYEHVWRAMGSFPRESGIEDYADLADNYVKFWMYGDKDTSTVIPDQIRIFNKVGWAYGYLTDAAYIVDLATGVEFLLVGTIHVNRNEIYNDGKYEYDEVGLPFFGQLGRAVYEYEVRQKRGKPGKLGPAAELFRR
ncbi:MAG: serine hydrolase [Saprospiraceae bacterium]